MRVPKDEVVGAAAGLDNSDAVISDRVGSSGISSGEGGDHLQSDWILQIVTYLVATICLLILILILVQVRQTRKNSFQTFYSSDISFPE